MRKHQGTESIENFKYEGIHVSFEQFKRVEFHEGIPDILDDIFNHLICFRFKQMHKEMRHLYGIIMARE